MTFRFPLKDVTIKVTTEKSLVTNPIISDDYTQISQHEFTIDVEGVAWYYARNGNYVEVHPYEGYDLNTLELYLNGSVYGAILHQRKILPKHGSCFNYNGKGIMICGESGAGKSSTTAAFSLKGAEFLTDDVTPVVFIDGKPHIWAISDRIKLWADSLKQLNQTSMGLFQITPETDKFYFPMEADKGTTFPLHQIFLLEIHDQPEVKFQEITGVEKFTALRNEIYRWEYLEGMPEGQHVYFKQISDISKEVDVTKVFRPANIPIAEFCNYLEDYMLLK